MAGLKDVARRVGVSSSTASRALNHPQLVRPDVVARVREAAAALGYVPNPFAQSLRGRGSRTVGLIVPTAVNEFIAEVAREVEHACFRAGYAVILCDADGSVEREADRARLLHDKRVEGILLISVSARSAATVEWLREQGVPVVLIERRLPGARVDSVVSDAREGVRAAVAHLAGAGHRRIGCLAGGANLPNHVERLAAFREAMRASGLAVDETCVRSGSDVLSYADGTAAALQLLRLPAPPGALFCTNDRLAIGALRGAAVYGVRVPADLAVVGYGDIEVAAHVQPPLTSVSPAKAAVAARAVQVLLRRIAEGDAAGPDRPEVHLIPTRLAIRDSSRAPVSTAPAPG